MSNPIVEFMQSHINQAYQPPSPAGQWLGGTLRDVSAGSITVDIQVRPEMLNPAGMLHGGMAASMIDEYMGAAVFTLDKPHIYATVNLAVDYLSSAREGDTVTAHAQVVRSGAQMINVQCTLHVGERQIARASSNLIRIKKGSKPSEA